MALAATGVGAAIGAAAVTSAIGVSAGTISAIAGGLSVAASLTAKKPTATGGGSQIEFSADPQAGVPYLVGRTGTAGNIILRQASDGWSVNTPNDLNDMVTILSGAGPIAGIESFTSDKVAISFDAAGNAIGEYKDKMFQRSQRGLCPEPAALTVQAGSSSAPTGWTAAHRLSGLAAVMWRLRYDAKQRFFQNGVPAPMWVARGVLVYDPRMDSTYPGGSGPCRWDDESTWVYDGADSAHPSGENPYLHALAWVIGRHQNGKRVMGLGSPIESIIVSDFVEGANVADANGWTIGGVVYSRPDTKWNVLKLMLQAGAGEPLKVGARIGCLVNTPRVSLATVTEADICGDSTLAAMQPVRNRLNTVTPRIRSEAHGWAIVPLAPIRVPEHVAEDGDERSREIEYGLVQDVDQGATLARYDIENTRELGPGTFPLFPRWINFKGGDCITIDRGDLEPLKVLILKRKIEPATGTVTFEVRSETDGKHAFALGQTTTPPPTASVSGYDPSVAAPAVGDWTAIGATLTANGVSIPAVVVTGQVVLGTADAAIFDLRPYIAGAGMEDGWIGGGVEAPTVTKREFTGVTPGTQYEVSVRYRVRGVIGNRRILGPVTAGDFTVPGDGGGDGGVAAMTATEFVATLRNGTRTVDVSWRTPRSPRFNVSRIVVNGTEDSTGYGGSLGGYIATTITLTGSMQYFDIVIRSYDDAGVAVDTDPITIEP
ncbi:hypothetical protein ASE75_06000 [Sphingomonas sp. Leaf17]|uniref:hypothetical protein n=1 Tax=Sphingomonas sp. Leaf17 TaxID=1735683 RepID=UPI0006F1D28F|nr:hypothetical protein [Sphingomonas sp. Leaf17]KQM65782.1 hypothetical protein ASE75_06000 [Sphingomonas sp. Leaf17]